MLLYTACFWHLHYLPQELSHISLCSASCLGAVTLDFTFPGPHWPHATLHPHKRKGNLLCVRSCSKLNFKKMTVKQPPQPLQVWRVSFHHDNHSLKNAGIWILFISSCGHKGLWTLSLFSSWMSQPSSEDSQIVKMTQRTITQHV